MSTDGLKGQSSSATAQMWIDQGGTCQDRINVCLDGSLVVQKLFSREKAATHIPVRMGTTVATNALLERKSCKILLITNQGLGDLLWIGD